VTCIEGRPEQCCSSAACAFVDIDHRYEGAMAHLMLLDRCPHPRGRLARPRRHQRHNGMRRACEEIRRHPGFR
jgi:hypothetical protein